MSRDPVITWSPSVTLVPTRACFNACGYCSFRRPPAPDELAGGWLGDGLEDGAAQALMAARPEALEVLLLTGELPPGSSGRPLWFGRLRRLSELALAAGRLPHTNAGPLSLREMACLGRFNPSLGLMLEGLGPAYDALHRQAPSKQLAVRLAQLEQAGRLGIPFTTGLLLGVGESAAQRRDALELIALFQQRWGHIQEVILQPWRPDGAAAAPLAPATVNELLTTIAEARWILPPEVHLQLPPNLWPADRLVEALEAGIDDLGGIDTGDVINPAYPQTSTVHLSGWLERHGWHLRPRLCVHRRWIPWLSPPLRHRAETMAQQLKAAG